MEKRKVQELVLNLPGFVLFLTLNFVVVVIVVIVAFESG